MSDGLTPMMRQYMQVKRSCPDAILFFRLGDFYEMFFDDAVEASRILHITLTSRGNLKGTKVPMCGVPHHASDNYIARLVKCGKKVAVCDQSEELPGSGGIVERKITRIVTPGTLIAEDIPGEFSNSYIMSLKQGGGVFGLAYSDISTGEFCLTEVDSEERLLSEICKISPAETLLSESFSLSRQGERLKDASLGVITVKEDWDFDHESSVDELKCHFGVQTLDGLGCSDLREGLSAAGALFKYLRDVRRSRLENIRSVRVYHTNEYMCLDRISHRHLELVQNQEDMTSAGTLFEVLDRTRTPMGKRELRRRILNPLLDVRAIDRRLGVVQFFYDDNILRARTREILSKVYDVERLANKVGLGTANARDLATMAGSMENIMSLKGLYGGVLPGHLESIVSSIPDLAKVIDEIRRCISDDPPAGIKDGEIIRQGYDKNVDRYRELSGSGKDWLLDFQRKEIEKTGINSLKVSYNKIHGYYIEITNSNLDSIPENYVRRQTLVNAERFVTEELKERENMILGAEEKLKQFEYEIFVALRKRIAEKIDLIREAASAIAEIDVVSSLAETAFINGYVRPEVSSTGEISIKGGRHPVLESILKGKEFVSNDCHMDSSQDRIFIITGSNMAGKSTFIRQVALICIMAQMGSFVPAEKAEIGIVDRIFTRVGASDRLYQGLSTFMVEMIETASILNNATPKSLIVLDEVGRGTSTFDGVSIAWAVVEYINDRIKGAKTMFATHYHELTELSGTMEGVRNFHLAVREWGEDIIFLYKVKPGSCDESFGIHVAKIAGMPQEVVKRSREILSNLHKDSFSGNIRSRFAGTDRKNIVRSDLFEKQLDSSGLEEKIRQMDINAMTPVDALKVLSDIKDEIESK